jgi:hypothetical protein
VMRKGKKMREKQWTLVDDGFDTCYDMIRYDTTILPPHFLRRKQAYAPSFAGTRQPCVNLTFTPPCKTIPAYSLCRFLGIWGSGYGWLYGPWGNETYRRRYELLIRKHRNILISPWQLQHGRGGYSMICVSYNAVEHKSDHSSWGYSRVTYRLYVQ